MKSMTGHGRGEGLLRDSRVCVELHSINRKQNEILVNLPRELAPLEPGIRTLILSQLARGRIQVGISVERGEGSAPSQIVDRVVARAHCAELRALQQELGLDGPLSINTLLRIPGILRQPDEKLDPDSAWPVVEKALHDSLHGLLSMRAREGAHLAADLGERLGIVGAALERITILQPAASERYRQNLQERIRKAGLDLQPDDERLLREVVLFAERCDFTEELTRLRSHFSQFTALLQKTEPVGRTMDFLTQEIAREFNTLGSKANDAEISQLIVTCKAEMEKIREQVQNIE
jgi:uncharacterized protein (TIGR00255 family)